MGSQASAAPGVGACGGSVADGRRSGSAAGSAPSARSGSRGAKASAPSSRQSSSRRGAAKVPPLNRNSVRKGATGRDRAGSVSLGPEGAGRGAGGRGSTPLESSVRPEHRIVIVGDLHGMAHKVKALWNTLEEVLGKEDLLSALVVFLGDYCDRGLYTKELLTFLSALQRQRLKHGARTVCLLGNHEFCLLGFLGLLPRPEADEDFSFRETWDREDGTVGHNERERWWGAGEEDDDIPDDMHLQGLRWAGACYERSYGSAATFASYGVEQGDRDGLLEAMPEEHLDFLQQCPWVHIEEHALLGRLIFVHAGLQADGSESCEEQLQRLQSRDARHPQPEALFGRDSVLHTPPQLTRRGTTVISGHHGRVLMRTHRLVVDSCSGDERNPLMALVLPEMLLVHHSGTLQRNDTSQVFTNWWPGLARAATEPAPAAPGVSPHCSPREGRRPRHAASSPLPGPEASTSAWQKPGLQHYPGHSMPLGDVSPLE